MKTITVSLADSDDETFQAEYFQIEDGWVTFKTEDHKAVVAYPEPRVTRIKSESDKPDLTVRISAAAFTGGPAPIDAKTAQIAARWAGR